MASPPDRVASLCALFAAELRLDSVPPDADFFLAGGHSLSALALAMSVERALGVPVGVRDLVECPTPALLAGRLAARSAPTRQRRVSRAELGNETRSLWLARQRGEIPATAYSVPCLLDVLGASDVDRLGAAVLAVQLRHPRLRTVFVERSGAPHAVTRPDPPPLTVVDEVPDPAAAVRAEIDRPFDLARGPLFRATLFRHGERMSLLLLADHLVCDGTSLRVLASELAAAYRAPGAAAGVLAPAEHARDEGELADALRYWRRVLSPPPEPLALPVSRPRRGPVGARTGIVTEEIQRPTVERLRALARARRAGLFVPAATAVAGALARLTGARDICLGTAVDRRARLGLTDAVGFHVVTVPLRIAVDPDTGWHRLLAEVASATVDAVDHSAASFDEIVAAVEPPRRPWRTPLFDVFATVYPHIDTGEAGDGIRLRGGPVPLRQGIVELSFQFVEHAHGLRLVLQHDTARYDRDTAERIARRVVDAADRIADSDPESEPAAASLPGPAVFDGFRFGT
ncbi:condensation domain-containing protein [Streptomyces sp. NBRC 109706]|uniref:condensation domain-containing protein n=1 Tax=Streptomyces sp. NBRC 109706 TaxID=1550035 RepID=UPI0007808A80|nr:condensation domain-containing protein [Streptomyces sp. NBRC 109706]